jgi:hypothetical protein
VRVGQPSEQLPQATDPRTAADPPVLLIGGAALTIAGLALLALEVARALTGSVLGTLGLTLLWLGVGLLAVGLLLLVLTVTAPEPAPVVDDEALVGHAEPAVPTTVTETLPTHAPTMTAEAPVRHEHSVPEPAPLATSGATDPPGASEPAAPVAATPVAAATVVFAAEAPAPAPTDSSSTEVAPVQPDEFDEPAPAPDDRPAPG